MDSKAIFSVGLLVIGGIACAAYALTPRKKFLIDRKPEVSSVDALFVERWSPRAMSGEVMSQEDLMALFEAARWAPSSYNEQPWRFIYAKRGTPAWDVFFDLLVPFNQEWCKNGSVLMVIISKKTSSRGGPNHCHSFDAGAAWENLALQGHLKGLVVHGMGGFDYEKARTALNIADDYSVEAMCVIGKPAPVQVLSKDLQAYEKPSGRKAIHEIAFEGTFKE